MAILLTISLILGREQQKPTDAPVVRLTEVRQHVGQRCTVELNVRAAKSARGRKMFLLSSEANFNSPANVSIFIPYRDAEKFATRPGETPIERYQGKTVRVTGVISVDSGRLQIEASDPSQIVVLGEAPEVKPSSSLSVSLDDGNPRDVPIARLKQLPRTKLQAKQPDHQTGEFEGVLLVDLLRDAGMQFGKELRGRQLLKVVLVEGADGYAVAFSLAEIDPKTTNSTILLADTHNGKPISTAGGALRLVVPSDKRFARWVGDVVKVSVRESAPNK